jgi:CheY-like chemotaxis protein
MSLGRVLVIDAESQVTLARVLMSLGYENHCVGSGFHGLRLIPSFRPDVVLLDYQFSGMTGPDVLAVLRREYPQRPVVVVSTDGAGNTASAAVELGAIDVVSKPVDIEALGRALRTAMAARPR